MDPLNYIPIYGLKPNITFFSSLFERNWKKPKNNNFKKTYFTSFALKKEASKYTAMHHRTKNV